MMKTDANLIVQITGILGIVGSLIFVGFEMQQSQRIAMAAQQQARATITTDLMNSFTASGVDYHSIYWQDNLHYELSKAAIVRRNTVHSGWFIYENDFNQYSQGLVDEATWAAKLRAMEHMYNKCSVRMIYDARKATFAEDFRNVIDAFPNQCE